MHLLFKFKPKKSYINFVEKIAIFALLIANLSAALLLYHNHTVLAKISSSEQISINK